MAINSLFSCLKPKENKFFPLIIEVGSCLHTAATLLVEFAQTDDRVKAKEIFQKIKQQEVMCDGLTNNIFEELNDTFITPFDREDIHTLCERLDDVLDYINSSAKRVVLFQPKSIPDKMIDMTKIVLACCESIDIILHELKNIPKKPYRALEYCTKLHDLENEGDDIYEHYVTELFQNEKDAIEIIKLKEIMQYLEKTTDMANVVSKAVKNIIVKYA
ncbi:MAG: DUF47 family protein [Paludibacteraceae bacterium]